MKVKLGKKASIFHDAYRGITITKGQVVDLNIAQQRSPKVQRALNGGFLVRVAEDPTPVKTTMEKFQEMVEAGMSKEKIKKAFTLDQLKEIANNSNIELEEGDTKDTILEALMESEEEEEVEDSKE